MAGEQVEVSEQFFTEIAVLLDQATPHLNSSNLNLLEHLSRRLGDSLNVLNILRSRCEELNIPETLTTKIRRFLEELHFIHTRIFDIIILENMISCQIQMIHALCPQLNQRTQDLGGHDLELQQLKSIDSMMYAGLGKMLLFIWKF